MLNAGIRVPADDTSSAMGMKIKMNIRCKPDLVMLFLCVWLSGCVTPPAAQIAPETDVRTDIPVAAPELDHYSAWIPENLAPTATVAQAMVHVALGKARLQAGDQLCGTSLPPAQIMDHVGPLRMKRSSVQDGRSFWYYRISQQPVMPGCANIDRTEQYRALQDQLPDWVRLNPAVEISHKIGWYDPL
jgi:hypothetical protein